MGTEIMKIHGGLIISSGKTVKNMRKFYGLRQEIESYDRTMRRLEGKLEYFVPGSLQSSVMEKSTSNYSSGYQINFTSQEINCATQMVEEDSTDSEGEDNSESDSRESELDEILGDEDEEQDESDGSENSEMADPNNNGVIVDKK